MTVPENAILRVVQQFTWDDGNIMQNVFNCSIDGGSPPYVDQEVADDMAEWMEEIYDGLVAAMSDHLTAGEATTYVWDSVGQDWDEVGSSIPSLTPVAGGEYLAHGVAAMIRATTTDPDVQGRKFFGGFTEDVAVDGGWTASALTLLAAAAIDWIAISVGTSTGGTITPGVWSVVGLQLHNFVGQSIVNAIANYQRRRRPGVGI